MPTVSPAMTVVLTKASELGIKIELRDKRTVYLDRRPCQAIQSKWHENFRNCRAMSLYMPRLGFADFLLYVADGQATVYVVPRGLIKYDTVWAEVALEPYKEAWHLLKETTAILFERKMESVSIQLRKIIAEADKHNLSHELVRSKRGESRNDYRTFMQRRILVQNKRCAIFTAKILPEGGHLWPTAMFKTPKDDWAEVLLYILGDDVFVVPRSKMPYDTTLDLQSSRIYDYRNSWCVLDGVDPTSPKSMAQWLKKRGTPVSVYYANLRESSKLPNTTRTEPNKG
jgi:hypothetical protein